MKTYISYKSFLTYFHILQIFIFRNYDHVAKRFTVTDGPWRTDKMSQKKFSQPNQKIFVYLVA